MEIKSVSVKGPPRLAMIAKVVNTALSKKMRDIRVMALCNTGGQAGDRVSRVRSRWTYRRPQGGQRP
jgi:hypothetical protein